MSLVCRSTGTVRLGQPDQILHSSRVSWRLTIHEAKTKFSGILREVRAGRHVTISYRGEAVAEIRPTYGEQKKDEETMRVLEEQGVLSRPRDPSDALEPLACRPGALKRFLESRS